MLGGLDLRNIAQHVYRVVTALGYAHSGANTDITSLASVDITNNGSPVQTLNDGANVDWNMDLGANAAWALAGNHTLNNPTQMKVGGRYRLRIVQDGTGGRTVNWGSFYKGINRAQTPPQPSPVPNAVTEYYFACATASNLVLVAQPQPNHGQCQLTKSGANLLLSPLNGNHLTISGKPEIVPDAGVTLGTGGLAANTTYYIYAAMSAGVMILEASATAPASQAGSGLKVKSTDGSRTLVGQARTDAGVNWVSSATQIFVRSWFNDGGFSGKNTFSADRSTASSTAAELNTEIRVEFLSWAAETIRGNADGSVTCAGATLYPVSGLAFDGAVTEPGFETVSVIYTAGANNGFCISAPKSDLAEGYHYATLTGRSDGANTATWYSVSAVAKAKTYLHISSRGH